MRHILLIMALSIAALLLGACEEMIEKDTDHGEVQMPVGGGVNTGGDNEEPEPEVDPRADNPIIGGWSASIRQTGSETHDLWIYHATFREDGTWLRDGLDVYPYTYDHEESVLTFGGITASVLFAEDYSWFCLRVALDDCKVLFKYTGPPRTY